ncbi:hypothetical protein AWENTII_007646 [Aspergillus wentii]
MDQWRCKDGRTDRREDPSRWSTSSHDPITIQPNTVSKNIFNVSSEGKLQQRPSYNCNIFEHQPIIPSISINLKFILCLEFRISGFVYLLGYKSICTADSRGTHPVPATIILFLERLSPFSF